MYDLFKLGLFSRSLQLLMKILIARFTHFQWDYCENNRQIFFFFHPSTFQVKQGEWLERVLCSPFSATSFHRVIYARISLTGL